MFEEEQNTSPLIQQIQKLEARIAVLEKQPCATGYCVELEAQRCLIHAIIIRLESLEKTNHKILEAFA